MLTQAPNVSVSIDVPRPAQAVPLPGPAPLPTYVPFPNAYEETHPDWNPDLVGRQSPPRGCGDSKACKALVALLIEAGIWGLTHPK